MEEIKKEKYLNESPIPISIEQTEKILIQMRKSICKIFKGHNGTGFFCKFPLLNSKEYLYVLITNNHILGKDDIKNNSTVTFTIGDETNIRNIKINTKRKKYTNVELDITIIEINPEKDNISKNNFLELDDNINQDEESLKNFYGKKSIYLLGYPEAKEVKVSYGIINSLNLDEKKINHLCNTKEGSSGSPILLLENSKIIGVHFGCPGKKFEVNYGTFIKYPYLNFLNNNEFEENEEKETEISSHNDNLDKNNKNNDEEIKYEFFNDEKYLSYFNELNEKIKNEKQKKYAKILFELFNKLENNKEKSYSIDIYQKDLFKWKITEVNNNPFIIDFSKSDPPEYNLNSIIFFEDVNGILVDLIDLDIFDKEYKESINIKINLEEGVGVLYEKIILLFDKLSIFSYYKMGKHAACCNIL